METLRIDILEPKAKQLLQDLVELKLIRIKNEVKSNFSDLLEGLRNKHEKPISLEDITKEVEKVRAIRYEKT